MTDLTEPLTALQEVERRALVSERSAVIALVSAIRRMRAASNSLLSSRYRDGEVDAVALHRFVSELEEIEACAEGTGD